MPWPATWLRMRWSRNSGTTTNWANRPALEPVDQPVGARREDRLAELDRPHQPEPAHLAHDLVAVDERRGQLEQPPPEPARRARRAPARRARAASRARPPSRARSGAKVEPWLKACSIESKTRSCTSLRHQQRPDRDVAARERLRDRDEVGLEAPVLEGEQPAGAAEPGLHLVDAEERAVAAAERLRRLEVAGGRQVHALALDRLDQEDGDVLAAKLAPRAPRGRRRAPGAKPGRSGPKRLGELGVAVRRERAERQPVEAVVGVDDPRRGRSRRGRA